MDELMTLEPGALAPAGDDPDDTPPQRSGIRRVHDDAGILVVKHASAAGRAGLRREAEVLGAVEATTVVRLVELRDLPDSTELVLRDTGGPSLASVLRDPATTPSEALRLLAETCDSVVRLHAGGWAHGRVTADHVLLTSRGRVRLCSMRAAMPIDIDPGAATKDRAALLRMVDDWVASSSVQRSPRRPLTRLVAVRLARRTRRLADAPDPVVLARILRRCALPQVRRPRLRSITTPTALATTAVLAAALLTALVVATTGEARSPSTRRPPPLTAPTTPAPTTPVTQCADSPAGASVDVDGDGCPEPVSIDGNSVVVGARRFRVGDTGDVIAVGDWSCDGRATVSVLRPSTGSVHVFDRWPGADTTATARLVGRVERATGFSDRGDRCGPPVLIRADGTSTTPELP